VSSLVAFGGMPAKLPAGWLESFLKDEREPVRLFQGGERVVVTSGPLRGLEGIYQVPDGETRAYVLLELLRKPCRGSFLVEALRRVA
jgi:transcriptional antiterminator RfaH